MENQNSGFEEFVKFLLWVTSVFFLVSNMYARCVANWERTNRFSGFVVFSTLESVSRDVSSV